MTDTTARRRRLVRGSEAARIVYGTSSEAATKRLARLEERGVLKAVRVGQRRDRWYSTDELERLVASAEGDA